MSSLLKRTPKLSKKKRKSIEENVHKIEKNEISTSHKIMNEIKSAFQSDIRKSKKKTKKKHLDEELEHKPIADLSIEEENVTKEEIVEVMNTVLCKISEDSKDVSEYSSNSDYSYNILEDSASDTSRENIQNEDLNFKLMKPIKRSSSSSDTPPANTVLRKSQSLSRKNSTAGFFKGIFKKAKSETQELRSQSFSAQSLHRATSLDKSTTDNSKKSSTSIKRKISNMIKADVPNNLKRSSSIRDFSKKGKSDGGKSMDLWSTSLQSLVENDIAVSYQDLSFINYDALNTIKYDVKQDDYHNNQLMRSQSCSVHNVSNI